MREIIKRLDPETRLFLACCRVSPTDVETEDLRNLGSLVRDWERPREMAVRHGLLSLFYKNVKLYLQDVVSPDFLDELKNFFTLNTVALTKQAAELGRVNRLFERENIRVVCLKGPAISLRVYSDVALRSSGDLDILVHSDHIERSEAILLRNGYSRIWPDMKLTPRRRKFFLNTFYHLTYRNRERNVKLELHFYPCNHMYESLSCINEFTTLESRGPQNPIMRLGSLADPQLILYLCEHGSYHSWTSLKWLVDVSELMMTIPENDWDSIAGKALRHDLARSLRHGMDMATGVLGTPCPAPVLELIRPNRAIRKLNSQAFRELNIAPTKPFVIPWTFRTIPQNLRMRTGIRFKLSTIKRRVVTTSNFSDTKWPDSLFGAYIFLRPLIWLLKSRKKNRPTA